MAKESTAPKEPLTPGGKPNTQHRPPHIQEHEFGKPSPIGPQQKSNHLFNIPKPNQARAEHHRVPHRSNNQPDPRARQNHPPPGPQGYRPSAPSGAVAATPAAKRSEPWDPFKPVAPSAYNNPRGGFQPGSVSIKRPENVTWTTPRAPRPIFQSKPLPPKPSNSSKNLQSFIDLTRDQTDPIPRAPASHTPSRFGAMDMDGYVDTAMANENIKALLEGAFEDEDDSQSKATDKKKKKKGSKKKQSKAKPKDVATKDNKKEQAADDLDDLAAQLSGVTARPRLRRKTRKRRPTKRRRRRKMRKMRRMTGWLKA
ncbi:unnamed protein product [Penicillium olsonii]|nr:unnamed protein product [Penicillium olsonii]